MNRIEEIRASARMNMYRSSPEDIDALLAEIDRLTVTSENRAAVEREWRRNDTEHKK